MRFTGFLRFFRALKLATLWDHLTQASQQPWLVLPFKIAYRVIIALWQSFLAVLRALLSLVTRLVIFFSYINFGTLREIVECTIKQRLTGLSAEMAFHAMLALFPAILAIIASIGLFKSLQSTLYQLALPLADVVPDEVRSMILSLIEEILKGPNQEVFSLSFLGAIWAFSGVISAAMAALDQIDRVSYQDSRPFWKAKLVALGLAVGTIILLILASFSVFISDIIVGLIARHSCLLESAPDCLPKLGVMCLLQPPIQSCPLESQLLKAWSRWNFPITLGIVSAAFGFVYRFGPSRWRPGTPILPGAVVAAILWAAISNLFRLYVSHFGNYNRTYGAIGTIIILLLWLYLSCLAMLLGAQLNVTVGEAMRKRRSKLRL